jgi:hypothetical protein
LAAAPLLSSCRKAGGWPAEWDQILNEKACQNYDAVFDEAAAMTTRVLGPTYQYHTRLRDMRAHPTRESLDYALCLLESGKRERFPRAFRILNRVLALQDTDPESKWYGIWGWYMEEPPSQMAPADWNWADFNGSTLLLIDFRHREELPEDLQARVREAIRHAAASVRRRNVSMGYTNIAIKGTFVTLAAAERLGDPELLAYAQDRMRRLCAEIDKTGTFNEYNSPTYARVSLTNLTRIRMFVRDEEARRRANAIEHRLWLHLARHWDAHRKQFAGPMSRCYSTDIGFPIWLEKALDGALGLAKPEERSIDRGEGAGETALHDYQVPEDLRTAFLTPGPAKLHRELFAYPSAPNSTPIQGTTYITPAFSLGSVNQGDFWVQRRPLLGYFGTAARPAATVTLRFVKDSYDFSSALLSSVQRDGCVLGLVNFRSPGGDRHISLEMIQDGQFDCSRLFLELSLNELATGFEDRLEDGQLHVANPGFQLWFAVRGGRFGKAEPRTKVTKTAHSLVLTVDLLPAGPARRIRWADIPESWLAFSLACAGSDPSGQNFRETCRNSAFSLRPSPGKVQMEWNSPAGALGLEAATRVQSIEQHFSTFRESIGGQPIPVNRLSDQPLAG